MASIKEVLHSFSEGPRMLALACQQEPIDRSLVRTAFSRFNDHLTHDSNIFRSSYFSSGTAAPENVTTEFLESLTTPGAIAYVKAMDECLIGSRSYWRRYDWVKVPVAFIKHLDHLGR